MDRYLQQVIEALSDTRGEEFFNVITQKMSEIIGADYTFIAELNVNNRTSKTLSLVADGKLVENIEYSLEHTPCEQVVGDSVCCYPKNVQSLYPNDQLLIDMQIEAYIGTPLYDSKGEVFGLIVALYKSDIKQPDFALTLFQIFSGRIEAEWERMRFEKQLVEANNSLEAKVAERTQALELSLQQLQAMQEHVIETEKMAALGRLVSGVAHEINTPLGVALTAASHVSESFQLYENNTRIAGFSQNQLEEFIETLQKSLPLIDVNLERAATLVDSFKRTAADQHVLELEAIDIKHYFIQIIQTFSSLLSKSGVAINIDIPDSLIANTYPGAHVQILTHLVTNSCVHAFSVEQTDRQIAIKVKLVAGKVCVSYRDNGIGIDEAIKDKIFEPFFTTTRTQGDKGLGLAIVYSLVKHKLAGDVHIPRTDKGFALDYFFTL